MPGAISGKRIGLLAGWASRRNGGVFEALVAQAELIRSTGAIPCVFAARDGWSEEDRPRLGDAEVHFAPSIGPGALAYAPALDAALEAAQLDCLHLHGIWQGSSLTGNRWARRHRRRYAISPHGMLDPWIVGRGRMKKALFRVAVERPNWLAASLFHALTEAEAADIGRWVGGARMEVVPNPAPPLLDIAAIEPTNEVVYLGRIHPKKNLAALIAGWRMIQPELPPDARLTIAGVGEPRDLAELRRLVADAGPQVAFTGPAYGETKRALLAHARYLVLPSLSEGLPMAVLDAWSAGTPTIMTEACHLPEGFAAGAAIRCGDDAAGIGAAIKQAFGRTGKQWHYMSHAARNLASGPFAAQTIASRWAAIYSDLMGQDMQLD